MLVQAIVLFCAVFTVCPIVFFAVILLCDRYLIKVIHPESFIHQLYERHCDK